MTKKKFQRIVRAATPQERERHAAIRQQVVQEFPPATGAQRQDGIHLAYRVQGQILMNEVRRPDEDHANAMDSGLHIFIEVDVSPDGAILDCHRFIQPAGFLLPIGTDRRRGS